MKLFKKRKNQKPLTTKNLAFSYTNQNLLQNINLNLKPGEIVSVIGPSGCGKSTLLKIIAGIISLKKTGKIKIFGLPRLFKKNSIGFAPQEISLIPDLSILDNIKIQSLNCGISEEKGLTQAKKLLTLLRLEENWGKTPEELSGGQQVRLNIILSLLHNPKIIILDEPFNGLDFQNRRLLWHFLQTMKTKGKSILLTSHLLTETQEHADRLIIIKKGKIFFQGKLESLRKKLKLQYIYELRFTHLSKENLIKIKSYCRLKEISLMESYQKYLMVGLKDTRQKAYLQKLFQKLNLKYEEITFREPNLDETFLKAE